MKECAITCIGIILATLGDDLAAELPNALSLLLDKLRNEITRIYSVKAISRIATSKLNVDLSPILPEVVKELSSFLRKVICLLFECVKKKIIILSCLLTLLQNNRQLKQSSLQALDDVVKKYGTNPKAKELFPAALAEVAPLIR